MNHISEIKLELKLELGGHDGNADGRELKPVSRIQKPTREQSQIQKPTREQCRKQLSRLNSKYGAPRDREDEFRLGRVLDILVRVSESDAHLERIIDALEQVDNFPDGYSVRQMAYDTRSVEVRANPDCPGCFGSGHFSVEKNGLSYAGRCDCWRVVSKATP